MIYIFLIVGFILLIKGADLFVDGASNIATKIGIPSIIVGLTIVSLGTSTPELAVSLISAVNKVSDIAIGNVVGSNLFNSLIVLGGTALVTPLLFFKETVKRDVIFNLLVTILVFVLSFGLTLNDNYLSRNDGLLLLLICILYIGYLISLVKKQNTEKELISEEISISKNILISILGIAGIVIGGDIVVDSATELARSLGMSDKLVGLTIVAMGTSLPELVTSIVAAVKGENEIALGNVLGSNIFNLLLILGASSAITPFIVDSKLYVDFLFLIVVSLIIGVMILFNKRDEKKITRIQGVFLIGIYIMYLYYIIIRN